MSPGPLTARSFEDTDSPSHKRILHRHSVKLGKSSSVMKQQTIGEKSMHLKVRNLKISEIRLCKLGWIFFVQIAQNSFSTQFLLISI